MAFCTLSVKLDSPLMELFETKEGIVELNSSLWRGVTVVEAVELVVSDLTLSDLRLLTNSSSISSKTISSVSCDWVWDADAGAGADVAADADNDVVGSNGSAFCIDVVGFRNALLLIR